MKTFTANVSLWSVKTIVDMTKYPEKRYVNFARLFLFTFHLLDRVQVGYKLQWSQSVVLSINSAI